MDFELVLGFSGQISAILLEIGPICLDLGHFAEIWAILLGFGLLGRIWVRIGPKGDEALRIGRGGRTDVRTDGQIPLYCTGLRPLRNRCPAPPSTSITHYLSRARVPLTTYCLWAAIF